jgi:hypothetical protein
MSAFRNVQNGNAKVGENGVVAPTLAKPSTPGTLLVATLVTSGNEQFSLYGVEGWKPGNAVATGHGRLEQWYCPAHTDGMLSPTFKADPKSTCIGWISEYSTPPGTTQEFEEKDGNSGTAGMDLISIVAVREKTGGALGVVSFAAFFKGVVPEGYAWTAPAGFTPQQSLADKVSDPVASFACTDVPAGSESLASTFDYDEGLQAWAASYVSFRCITPTGHAG